MDKDLIIKLIRLANNNPNEHEANLAARKACKLLDESDFMPSTAKRPSIPDRPVTWHREVEVDPFFRNKNYKTTTPPYDPFENTDFDYEKWRKDFYKLIHRCIHCRKIMIEGAEIANKICAECWQKERKKYGQ